MGRTISYFVPKTTPVSSQDFEEINRVQQEYNQRFTWECERLSLEQVSWWPLWANRNPNSALPLHLAAGEVYTLIQKKLDLGESLHTLAKKKYVKLQSGGYLGGKFSASGFTKIGDNEWEAYLVLRFLTWVSQRYPHLLLHVRDEGDFILAGSIILVGGQPKLDRRAIYEQRLLLNQKSALDELRWFDFTSALKRLDQAMVAAAKGVFFAEVKASDYSDNPDLRRLSLPQEQMLRMSLDELACYIDFPGESSSPGNSSAQQSGRATKRGV
jgi:hypothetical protein